MQLTFEEFKSALADKMPTLTPEQIHSGASFVDCGIDSLMAFEIAMTVEDVYSVHIPDDELAGMSSVEDVWSFTIANMQS